jgi:hypothetical protein
MRQKIILIVISLCFALQVPTGLFAHHPAEDIVDEEIFAFIDSMVADTPHATLDFDDMGNMVITTDFVSTAEAMIQQGLLSHISLLDGDVSVTIEFDPGSSDSLLYSLPNGKTSKRHSKWSEWGSTVVITVIQENAEQ